MSGFDTAAALKTFGLAAVGYLVVLAIGVSIGVSMDDDGFGGLGMIALTTVILAPIGAVIGAYAGMRRFGNPVSSRSSRTTIAVFGLLVVVVTVFSVAPFQFMAPLLGLALSFVVRSGMVASTDSPGLTPDAPAA